MFYLFIFFVLFNKPTLTHSHIYFYTNVYIGHISLFQMLIYLQACLFVCFWSKPVALSFQFKSQCVNSCL